MLEFSKKPFQINGIKAYNFMNISMFDFVWQLGIILNGLMVVDTITGGPAYDKLFRGNEIVEVDGKAATEKNVRDLLIGCDVPGTIVTLTVSRLGAQVGIRVVQARAVC